MIVTSPCEQPNPQKPTRRYSRRQSKTSLTDLLTLVEDKIASSDVPSLEDLKIHAQIMECLAKWEKMKIAQARRRTAKIGLERAKLKHAIDKRDYRQLGIPPEHEEDTDKPMQRGNFHEFCQQMRLQLEVMDEHKLDLLENVLKAAREVLNSSDEEDQEEDVGEEDGTEVTEEQEAEEQETEATETEETTPLLETKSVRDTYVSRYMAEKRAQKLEMRARRAEKERAKQKAMKKAA
jgi:hypothetical protein